MNGRFFHKRAYYLAVVAQSLKASSDLNVDVSYLSPQSDPRRTHLVLKPKPTGSSSDFTELNASIHIHLSLSAETSPIPIHRLSPSHSNLRLVSTASGVDASASNPPTPIYNNTLLQAFTPTAHLLDTYQYKSDIPSFAHALSLLRVWANQRGFSGKGKRVVRGFEAVGGAWWGFLLAVLVYGEATESGAKGALKRKPLGKGLSSYQLFRAAMDFLGESFSCSRRYVRMLTGHSVVSKA